MTSPDSDRYVSAGLDPGGSGQVLIERNLVGNDGLVEMRHPNLPDQPIRVFPGGVAARMLAGWAPVEPEQPEQSEQSAEPAAVAEQTPPSRPSRRRSTESEE